MTIVSFSPFTGLTWVVQTSRMLMFGKSGPRVMGATTVATGSPKPTGVAMQSSPARSSRAKCCPGHRGCATLPGQPLLISQLAESIPQPTGDLGQRRNRQLSGRRHYSPKWPLQTAAGWSNPEQPHGPIQNQPKTGHGFPQSHSCKPQVLGR